MKQNLIIRYKTRYEKTSDGVTQITERNGHICSIMTIYKDSESVRMQIKRCKHCEKTIIDDLVVELKKGETIELLCPHCGDWLW